MKPNIGYDKTMPNSKPNLSVLQIVKGLDIGNIHGGAERFGVELAIALQLSGINVTVCAFFRMDTYIESNWLHRLKEMQIPCFSVSTWISNNHFQSYMQGIRTLQVFLNQNPFEICHSHFQLGTVAALFMKANGLTKKAIRTCHVTTEWESGAYGWIREQLVSKWVFPLFLDAEVGVSQTIVDRLNTYPGRKIVHRKPILIYNGVTKEAFLHHEPLNEILQPTDIKIIGVVGRLSPEKGIQFFIEAARIVHKTFSEIQFWIIGDGELREKLESLTMQYNLLDCVRFFGQREDAIALISKMDLLVVPSLREGLPTVVLEGFAQGIPVLGTDIAGIRELIHQGENGWLVPPTDSKAMANCIVKALFDHENRIKYIASGKEKIKHFTIEEAAEKYKNTYIKLMGHGV